MIDNSAALRQAARIAGRPLRQHEIDSINNTCYSRAALEQRFIKVIRGAGYTEPEIICAEHIDEYMKNIPEFIKMLEDYERSDYDPD